MADITSERCAVWFEPDAKSAAATHVCGLEKDHAGDHACAVCPGAWPVDLLYDEVVDVCTWARENGYQLAYDWIMDRFAEYANDEKALPVTPSRTDRQPPASSSGAKGGLPPSLPTERNGRIL